MTLRIKLALEKQWSEPKFYISSPSYPLAHAPHTFINLFMIINEIVGDLHRILEYPKLGYQSEILVPKNVIQAYHFLIDNGYDLHLCNGNRNIEFK
ncbi:hypothetical protein LPTSP4_36780 [Leptospira ryugenii]|uniref:Uncharacterized protein n=2 Tax=Leptospira ryugenii TaxID=1917863 RepID=A0A2P2E5I7_9LEPT|nr:hypothetical protein LPTSP4_36780 [Leptospira ryugenii]